MKLKNKIFGILFLLLLVLVIIPYFKGKKDFPKTGRGIATADEPIEAYIDPLKTHTIGYGDYAKFVFKKDKSKVFIAEGFAENNQKMSTFWGFQKGNYYIYAKHKGRKLIFEWW